MPVFCSHSGCHQRPVFTHTPHWRSRADVMITCFDPARGMVYNGLGSRAAIYWGHSANRKPSSPRTIASDAAVAAPRPVVAAPGYCPTLALRKQLERLATYDSDSTFCLPRCAQISYTAECETAPSSVPSLAPSYLPFVAGFVENLTLLGTQRPNTQHR